VAVLIASLLLAGTGAAVAVGMAGSWLEGLPDINDPDLFEVAQTTRIYSADGVLLANLYLENRQLVSLDEISPHLVDAVVSVEDERFYEHNGVDFVGLVRATLTNLTTDRREGASTLTQQYIRNTILSEERFDITYQRKFREAYLALELEKTHSKDEILEMYLNTVYYGEGAYGAEAAALTYFNKHASELTIAEAALLAGLPQAPSRLTPYENPDGAVARRQWVLAKMRENGKITEDEYEVAKLEDLHVERSPYIDEQGVYSAPYFVSHIKKLLQDEYGTSLVFKGGLTVYTTLDTRLQTLAEEAVTGILDRSDDPDAALVAIDPRDGHVRAMVGGRDWQNNKFNFATQARRQCGSSFKMFTLVTAIEAGMPPNKRKVSGAAPAKIPIPGSATPWTVHNAGGGSYGYVTLQQATVNSINTAYGRLIAELGAASVAETANRMGIESEIRPYLSITLGSEGVTPVEMASAFGTLAADGVHNPHVSITKIVDADGDTIFEHVPEGEQALSHSVAYATTQVLQSVVNYGTATRARLDRPVAGKTGTTQDYRDAWFIGYTPQLVASVWMGYTPERPMTNVHGRVQFGGTFPALIWHEFMVKAMEGEPKLSFNSAPPPSYTWKDEWDVPTVPKVVGMTAEDAIALLKEAGFEKITVKTENHETVPAGLVAKQSPEAGAEVLPEKTEVTLIVSLGPEPKPEPPPPPADEPTVTPTPTRPGNN
jgi:1A family penicillin-binding protein